MSNVQSSRSGLEEKITTLVDHDPVRLQATHLPAGLRAVCATPASLRPVASR